MNSALEELRRLASRDAVLWVLEANDRARTFYGRGGWSVDGATKIERRQEAELREVRYRITL